MLNFDVDDFYHKFYEEQNVYINTSDVNTFVILTKKEMYMLKSLIRNSEFLLTAIISLEINQN